jgi:HSP20 family protein
VQQKLATRASPQMKIDVVENETGYELLANLPGVKKGEIAVEVDREAGLIKISAHRVARERSDDERWHRRERIDTTVARSLTLPRDINFDGITSRLDSGVLHVQMRKVGAAAGAPAPTRQRITVA